MAEERRVEASRRPGVHGFRLDDAAATLRALDAAPGRAPGRQRRHGRPRGGALGARRSERRPIARGVASVRWPGRLERFGCGAARDGRVRLPRRLPQPARRGGPGAASSPTRALRAGPRLRRDGRQGHRGDGGRARSALAAHPPGCRAVAPRGHAGRPRSALRPRAPRRARRRRASRRRSRSSSPTRRPNL